MTKNFPAHEICQVCQGHEYQDDHFVETEFIPKDQFSPSILGLAVHKSHFKEVNADGADAVYRKDGKYVREV